MGSSALIFVCHTKRFVDPKNWWSLKHERTEQTPGCLSNLQQNMNICVERIPAFWAENSSHQFLFLKKQHFILICRETWTFSVGCRSGGHVVRVARFSAGAVQLANLGALTRKFLVAYFCPSSDAERHRIKNYKMGDGRERTSALGRSFPRGAEWPSL